jgi:hypothetical protein
MSSGALFKDTAPSASGRVVENSTVLLYSVCPVFDSVPGSYYPDFVSLPVVLFRRNILCVYYIFYHELYGRNSFISILEFASRDWGKPRNTSVRILILQVDIRM